MMRALLAVAALARAAVVNVSFSRGGAWSPSPLEACVYEPHHLKSGKIHHICHCEQGTWTPTVGGNATRFAEDACGLLRSERFHFLGDSIVEQNRCCRSTSPNLAEKRRFSAGRAHLFLAP